MTRRPSLRRLMFGGSVACALAVPAHAQPPLEYDVKAALLLNFARFIEWPESAFADARTPIDICVFTPNPFGQALDRTLQAESVGTHPLSTRNVRNASEGVGCHLLFVPAGTESRAAELVRRPGPHTVTVGESNAFEDLGGAVSFVLEQGRIRFNVNLHPVEERGVRISARMLQLAGRVERITP